MMRTGHTGHNEVIRNYFKSLYMELIVASYIERVPLHWGRPLRADDYHRFYLILGGEGRITVNQHTFSPTPGQLVWLPAGTPLTYSTVNTDTYRKYWCHFTAKVGSFHLSQLIDFPYVIRVKDMTYLERLFEQLRRANQTSDVMTSPLRTNMLLYEIMTYFIDNAPSGTVRLSSSTATSRSNEILQFIETHLSESLTAGKLAEAFHYNPNYFSRYFKSLFNMTPNEYLGKIRMERAKWLLTHTLLSVEDIAGKIGLERFYFSNAFKRSTSLSPSDYRSLHHADRAKEHLPSLPS